MKSIRLLTFFTLLSSLSLQVMAESVDETRGIAADGTVSVSNISGEINISVWDRNEAQLTGELGENLKLEVTESANGVRFEVLHINDDDEYDESELELRVPAGASIVAEGVSSDISIDGSSGNSVNVESVSGDIDISASVDRLELTSVSGEVVFSGSSSRTAIESVAGDIEIEGVNGEVSVSTVSGDLVLVAGDINLGKFETVSGSLDISTRVTDGGRLTIEGMNGDVELYLPSDQSGGFKAQTFSGDISTDFGSAKEASFGPGSSLKYSAGDTGTQIRVETFSGDIRIGHK
jgi:DUF4097 and DUF4098 domain-containing protein YvlB